ncbi:MAG: chemotaxis protein CheA [Deltaproteobacteria bacterium]|nr:chemotaxis protein CheA [Deltaproteobacteria bacterium]
MNPIEEIIQKLQSVIDTVETIGLNDVDGWNAASSELYAILPCIPDAFSALSLVLELSVQGINGIVLKTACNNFASVETVSKSLCVCKQCLEEGALSEDLVDTMIQSLNQIISGDAVAPEPLIVDAENSTVLQTDLNDLAALWVQQEPDDAPGVSRIKQSLVAFSDRDGINNSVKDQMLKSIEILDAILLLEVDTLADAWTEAGICVERAIQLMENPDDIQPKQSEIKQPSQQKDDALRDYMPNDPDSDLIGEFVAEANDLIARAEEALLELEVDPEDMDAVGTVFRAFHTIKGTSAFLELSLLSEMGHHAESLLSRVRDKEIRYQGGYADLALRSLDMIKTLMHAVEKALGGEPLIKPEGYDVLMDALMNPEAAGVSEERDDMASPRIGDILVAQGKADRQSIETLVQDHSKEPLGMAAIKTGTASVNDVAHALRAQERMKGPAKQFVETSVRVSTDRLDRLIDMVGEMVIAHSMVAQDNVVMQAAHYELLKKVNHTSKIVRGLQDLSMSMRMVPLKATFQKMARLVRDVARKVGKNVTFVTEGEDTEIDRNLVDVINDPLVHMVRNAVDHGIESPEVRKKNGKPLSGTVKLSAFHSAGSVVVQIIDDGKGLDRNAILAKAIEKGMITDSSAVCDRDVYNMILEPGFSTAEVVTDVSGRGVGMDVVKKNIESLRGQVEITSEPGKGSVFRMSLPLTLAIIDGMVLRAGQETYVIPTVSIVRSIKPDPKDISTIFNKGRVLSLQGKLIPLYRLTRLYEIADSSDDHEELVVVIEDDGNQAGLIIDELVGRQQVVIKTLGETMQKIPGISGGAIMPNGRVGLIVDIAGLMKLTSAEMTDKKEDRLEKVY